MKTLLLNLWAWALLHPAEVSTAIVSVLGMIAAATVANARAKGAPVGLLARFVDRLAVKTRQGAKNAGWSWPAFGRSIFEAAVEASMPEPQLTSSPDSPTKGELRETSGPVAPGEQLNRDGTPPARYASTAHVDGCGCRVCKRSSGGFAQRGVLEVIAGVVMLALGISLLTGCASTTPNVQAIPPYVVEREGYGSCAETGGKIEVPRAGVVALLTSVCWLRADSGLLAIDASAEPAIDPKDGGVVEGGE